MWTRALISGALAVGGLAVTDVSRGAPIEGVTQFGIHMGRSVEGEITLLGHGFFRFDQAAVDQMLDEWLEDPDDLFIHIEFPVLAAEFEMFGHTFRDEEIVWQMVFDQDGDPFSIQVTMGGGTDPFLQFGSGDESSQMRYSVNGNSAMCIESTCDGHDVDGGDFFGVTQFLEWFEQPVPAPEPGTLALLGVGLIGLGLTRGKRH